ncbi:MAG: outer membrane protein [Rhodomicrobium sp.]
MIRRVLLSAVSGVALASSAYAADIYSPGPASYAAVALPSNWSGFYLGINGGYGGNNGVGFTEDAYNIGNTPATNYAHISGGDTIAGGFGGGQLGYNFQLGNFVYGIETDIQGSGIMGSGAEALFIAPTTPGNFCGGTGGNAVAIPCAAKNDLSVDYFGTVRGRLGYNIGGTLIYVTGGFAYGGVDSRYSYADYCTTTAGCSANRLNLNGKVSNTGTQTGWAAGAGVEYKISPSWSLKGEYQFVDLGSMSAGPGPTLINTTPTTQYPLSGKTTDVAFNTVRVGVNYFFNTPYEPLK